MRKTKNKVCNHKIKRIVEEKYYPISFIESVNVMYQLTYQKRVNEHLPSYSANLNKT